MNSEKTEKSTRESLITVSVMRGAVFFQARGNYLFMARVGWSFLKLSLNAFSGRPLTWVIIGAKESEKS